MKKRLRVMVLMGGKSPEYEVSLISGREVVKNLDKEKYKVSSLVIPKSGGQVQVNPKKTDVVFIAMHGPFGEDGTVQGMLEMMGVKYTGSGVLASALGMNKIMFRKVMQVENIPSPKYIVIHKNQGTTEILRVLGKPPYFVKPSAQGSSVGTTIVEQKKNLIKALNKAFKYGDTAIVEEYIKGTEVTCALFGNENPLALPVIEILPKNKYFDYESKYAEEGTQEIVPARISKLLTKRVQEIAVKVYQAVGCRGFARVDFLLRDNKYPVVLEINTIPGLTPISLFPKAAKAAGVSYSKLLDKIIEYAIKN